MNNRSLHESIWTQTQPRVQSSLLRVFLLQLALISLITVAGIIVASLVAEKLLVHQALVGEARYFWNRRAEDSEFPLPNTLNLQSWFDSPGSQKVVPAGFEQLPAGQHRIVVDGDDRIVYVSEHGSERLYLLFQNETVSKLAYYFGVLPLTLVLLIMYSLAFLTYWLSKRAVSPIASLADSIERFDFNARDASELDLSGLLGKGNSETQVLARALDHFVERSKVSIERERNFTRYASHELRTPIAVIRGSVDSLQLLSLDGSAGRAVDRIKRASEQMAQLINSLLMLARGRNFDDDADAVDVCELVEELVEEHQSLENKSSVTVRLDRRAELSVIASPAAISSVLGNIIRNALKYTHQGEVVICVQEDRVSISDTGAGFDESEKRRIFEPFYRIEKLSVSQNRNRIDVGQADLSRTNSDARQGLGLGLAIVQHFCDIYQWTLQVASTPGKGTRFDVIFK
ncbi:MAG: hypothetical protein KTR32_18565 [Granulosicoccus sp.]|nr:hypothetical protein [Granulosicoccus sp.]